MRFITSLGSLALTFGTLMSAQDAIGLVQTPKIEVPLLLPPVNQSGGQRQSLAGLPETVNPKP